MALRFVDGFDHYVIGLITRKWTTSAGTQSLGTGRFGGSCFQLVGSTSTKDLTKVLDAQATWVVGFGWQVDEPVPDANQEFLRFQSGGTVHCSLRHTTAGDVDFIRGGGVAFLGTVITAVLANVWYHIQVKVTIDDATGSVIVRVNDAEVLNLSGVDTRNGAVASADRIALFETSGSGNPTYRFDDFYVCDTTGGVNDDFLGDCRVETLFPSGNGNTSNFDGSDGNSTDNYLLVDESSPDDETTYVESPDVGDKDTYAHGDLTTTSGTVHGIQINPTVRKTDAGARSFATVARHSGTEEDGPNVVLGSTYLDSFDPRDTKPGGGAWSVSDINAAEFGVKVTV